MAELQETPLGAVVSCCSGLVAINRSAFEAVELVLTEVLTAEVKLLLDTLQASTGVFSPKLCCKAQNMLQLRKPRHF